MSNDNRSRPVNTIFTLDAGSPSPPVRAGCFISQVDSAEPTSLWGQNPHLAPRGTSCPYGECDGSGFVLREEDDTAAPCRCREQRVARARTGRLASQIPRKYRGVAFDRHPINLMEPMFVRPVQQFCRAIDERLESGDSLGFLGDRGTGKTSLAMTIPIEAMRRNLTVAVYTGPDLLTAIRSTYDDSSYSQLMESLVAVDLLHIEDLAVARPTEWVLEQLYTVINARYQDERSIVFTADVSVPSDLGAHIGDRTASRLVEMCGERIVVMFGDDHRTATAHEISA
ncbi:MAG: replication protein DnaC [Thermoleophilales bacterium]|nr:replication protein DnaC [Thermoleophilales bacterium]